VSGVGDPMIRITFGEQVGKSAANTMFHMVGEDASGSS
jgi:hypothetical protein